MSMYSAVTIGQLLGISTLADLKSINGLVSAGKEISEICGTQELSGEAALEILRKHQNAYTMVTNHFKGAQVGTSILAKADAVLLSHGCNGQNTLYAQSICPDEINHESGDITELFSKHMGEVFHMGGLGGIPFSGETGFVAFSHHVPDGGNLFILFASHIGISNSSKLGHYTRLGQTRDGTACGAACGALAHCKAYQAQLDAAVEAGCQPCDTSAAGRVEMRKPGEKPSDYQMDYIKSEIFKRLRRITKYAESGDQQAALAKHMFEIAKTDLLNAINFDPSLPRPNLYLLGGVQINMPHPTPDFFQPRMFKVYHRDGRVEDLMQSTFGFTVADEE